MKLALLIAVASLALRAQDPEASYQRARDLVKEAEQLRPSKVERIQLKLTQARTELTAALASRPDYQAARNELARVEVLREDYPAALELVKTLLRADPKDLEAQLTRARALVGMGKPGVARLFLNDALAQSPDNPEVLFNLGQACLADRRFDEAGDAFRKLWQLEPATTRGMEGVAKSLLWTEQPEAAVKLVQAEADKAPGRADILLLLGRVAFEVKRYDLAIDAFQATLKNTAKPTAEFWGRFAEAYQAKGDMPAAVDAFKKAFALDPADPQIVSGLAKAFDAGGLKKEAADAYRTAIILEPRNAVAMNNLAYLLADMGANLDEALDLARRAKDLLKNNPEVTDTLGWVYFKSNKLEEAIAIFQDLVTLHPSNPTYHYHLGLTLAKKGDVPRALAEFRKALAERPPQDDVPQIREQIQKLEGAKP